MAGNKTQTGIIKGFNLDDIRKKRARLNASNGVDLLTALRAINPDIEKLNVGDTLPIKVEKRENLRKTVMQIVAKLSNLTPKGGDWAGRKYDVVSDPETLIVYVQRGEDGEPVERKRGTGRPPASENSEASEAAAAA